MADHALELSFDAASSAAVEEVWEALRAAGIPSQADHRSMTNAPHLTLVAARGISPDVVPAAVTSVGPLLPATLSVRGLVVIGTGTRLTLALLAEPEAQLAAATAALRASVPSVRHPVWTPHVTLARRVPRRLLPRAFEVLAEHPAPSTLLATRLRWWDPDHDVIETVAGS